MCDIGKDFTNIQSYNELMRNSVPDKLFFMDRLINADCSKTIIIVDFGCADGSLINIMCDRLRGSKCHIKYIGYDISDCMIDLAKTNFNGDSCDDVHFTTSWKMVMELANVEFADKKILVLSSVIHEVYSYGNCADVADFWKKVFNSGFSHIVIRDMCITNEAKCAYSDPEIVQKVIERANKEQLRTFEEKWGNITNSNKNLIHFLLKYRYKINWERENNENYLPVTVEEIKKMVESAPIERTGRNKYNFFYLETFRVPFLDKCFKEDFGISLNWSTHVKMILIQDNSENNK